MFFSLCEWNNFDQDARRRTFVSVFLCCFLQATCVIYKQLFSSFKTVSIPNNVCIKLLHL